MDEAIIGLACDANSAVSSANVATIISVDTGKSAGVQGHYLGVCPHLLGMLWRLSI